jgi:hypothetical protein
MPTTKTISPIINEDAAQAMQLLADDPSRDFTFGPRIEGRAAQIKHQME